MSNEIQQGDVQAAIEAGRRETQVINLREDVRLVVRPDADGASRGDVFDLERYADNPRRAVGNVTLRDIASFTEYVKRHKSAATVIFADDEGGMRAVFNHHGHEQEPGWRDLTAMLVRPRTPAFEAWMRAAKGAMDQVAFANFLEERLGDIADPDGASLLDTAEHFRAHTIVRFRSQQRLRDGQTQLEYIEQVEGGAEGDGKLTMPDLLTVMLQPFRDGPRFAVQARLRWRVEERRVRFSVLFDDALLDELEQVYADAMEAVAHDTEVPVFSGTDA